MKIEFRNLAKPFSDYQTRYFAILPYATLLNERNRKEYSWWLYLGWLQYCIAIKIVSVPSETGKSIEEGTFKPF